MTSPGAVTRPECRSPRPDCHARGCDQRNRCSNGTRDSGHSCLSEATVAFGRLQWWGSQGRKQEAVL